jgi:hypothetical protein
MGGVRHVRVTTTDGKNVTVTVEYQDGFTHVILADQLTMPSPLDPAAAKIQVANQLKALGTVRTQASIRLRSRSRFHFSSPQVAHRDGRRFDGQPSLSGHCGHGPIFIAQRSVANDPMQTFAQAQSCKRQTHNSVALAALFDHLVGAQEERFSHDG